MFNKDKIKGFISGVCVALVLSSGAVFADTITKTVNAVYNNIKIVIDGKQITPKDANGNTVEPFIIDGTTYLPVRAVSEALGKEVDWDGTSNTVYIGKKPEREFFELEMSTLEPYKDKALLSIEGTSLNGGLINFYVAQDGNENYLRYYADNFSPVLNLQTLTMNGVPMAKVIVDNAVNDLKLIYAGCAEAEKSGYASKAEVIKEVDSLFADFMLGFKDDADFNSFCEEFGTLPEDIKSFAKKSFLADSYINSIYEENLNKEISTEELEKEIRSSYITAKHILVEDEALAKEIIKKIENGEDFDTLMKNYNIDPGATSEGYTFTKGQMVESFEEASFALTENTYTKTPVKSAYGYHIIYRLPFNERYLKTAISEYKVAVAQNATTEFIEKLRNNASVTFSPEFETYVTTIK